MVFHSGRLERPAMDKNSSLLGTFVKFGRKKIIFGTGVCAIKIFTVVNNYLPQKSSDVLNVFLFRPSLIFLREERN